ncbi:hypothetical protein SDC9_127632 [bioreactor metagenome]|uniref:Uncharacterized protein n=1 Tax=bioreactor metagenome TaxID=1076179 RepID=A0A645CUK5_9ZZZZ
MTIFNFKNINKKIIPLIPIMIVLYFFCVKNNYLAMERYSFFNRISMYDMYPIVMTDWIIELITNLPFLLILLINTTDDKDYFLRTRFKSRKKFGIYRIKEILFINVVLSIIFVISIYCFGYIFTNNSHFNWFDLNSPISILFNNSERLIHNFFITNISTFFINLIMFFIRNMTISILVLILSKFMNKLYSFVLAIVPFFISNDLLINCYMLDINNINNIILILINLFFILLLLLNLIYIFLYLEERVM